MSRAGPGIIKRLGPNSRAVPQPSHAWAEPLRFVRKLSLLFPSRLQQTQAVPSDLLLKRARESGKELEAIRTRTDQDIPIADRLSRGRPVASAAQHENSCGAIRHAVGFGQHAGYRPCCGRQDGQQHYPAQTCSRKLEHPANSLYDEQISGFTPETYLRPINKKRTDRLAARPGLVKSWAGV